MTTITAAEERRQQMSNVMIALITATFGSIGVLDLADPVAPIAVALFLSVVWNMQLRHMQMVAQAKWGVVIEHEKRMTRRLFTEEYERIKAARASLPTWRRRQTSMEMLIPRALILGFSGYLVYRFLAYSGAFEWN